MQFHFQREKALLGGRASRWPVRFTDLHRWFWFGAILILSVFHLTTYHVEARHRQEKQTTRNATNPLIYVRLRFEEDSLQVLNRFQKYLAIDEHKVRYSVNETRQADEDHPNNWTELVEYSYYQNDHVEADSLTYDDLVFEAIDVSYLTKLIPFFVTSYDNKQDVAKASDKRLVSRSRCDKEMDYMMEQLYQLEHSRVDGTQKAGVQLSTSLNAEVIALFDAFGTEQPGLLLGNHYWPGNWRQCRKSRVFHRNRRHPEHSVDFKSRYCVASLRSKRWDKLVTERARELEAGKHFEHEHQQRDYLRYHRIQIGVCMPESCDSRIRWRRENDIHKLAVHKLSEPLRSYELADLYCLPDETSELRKFEPSSIWFMVFVGLWTSCVAVATVYDIRTRHLRQQQSLASTFRTAKSDVGGKVDGTAMKSVVDKLVDSMSYLRNLERLFETESCKPKPVVTKTAAAVAVSEHHLTEKQSPFVQAKTAIPLTRSTVARQPPTGQRDSNRLQVNRLQFLNSLKVLATLSIVLGHVAMLLKHMDKYTLDYDCVNEWMLHFQFSAVFFVDWHFVMSGFLAAYTAFAGHRVERHTPWSWLGTIVHRYLRLAPLYLLLFWFSQSMFMYIGDGPLWDYATSNQTVRSICRRESFIYPLTLTSNLHPIYEECVMPSWYISCDFQFFLLTPFLMILLHKSPLLGWLVTLGTIGASVAARLHRYLTDPRAQLLSLMRPRYDLYQRNNWDMYPTYIYPQYRIGSYLIGLLAGHYVYMVLSGRWSSPLVAASKQDHIAGTAVSSPSNRARSSTKQQGASSVSVTNKFYLYGTCTFSCVIIVYMFFATWFLLNTFPKELEPYADYIGPVVYSVSHVTAATGFALFITTMAIGNSFVTTRNFMSLPFWTVLARFNFIIFIIQIEAINWISGSSDNLIELNNIETFKYFMCLLCLLYLLSGILTPLFELPIGLLERNFISPLFAPPAASNQKLNNHPPPGLSLPVPVRRNNSAANAKGGDNSKMDLNQAYELGRIAAGESTRLVSDQQ